MKIKNIGIVVSAMNLAQQIIDLIKQKRLDKKEAARNPKK